MFASTLRVRARLRLGLAAFVLALAAASVLPAAEDAPPADAPAQTTQEDAGASATGSGEEAAAAEAPPAEPKPFEKLLAIDVFGFSAEQLGWSLGIILAAFVLNTTLRFLMNRRKSKEDDKEVRAEQSLLGLVIESSKLPVRVAVWAVAIRIIGAILQAPPEGVAWLYSLVLSLAVAVFIYRLVDVVEYYFKAFADRTETKLDDMLVPALRKSLRVLVVIIAALHIYQSATDQPITTLLAGLGIGGLAFALAAQDTVKNLFGFAMIVADRPFMIGERINFNGHDGVIEAVGFRSVKLRRLDGHQVIIPNGEAANTTIHNIGRRPYIRRIMNVTITYDTPLEKVETAIEILREILADHEGMDPEFPPRVYFNDLNADSLNILAIYWYHPPEYWDYLDHAQRVNLELMRRYEAEGIEFAFPTQTLYLAGDPNRQLVLEHLTREAADQASP
jgi:MscS family membrane protein